MGKPRKDQETPQKRSSGPKVARRSLPRTKARAEVRQARHQRQVDRKQARLEARARRMAEELGLPVPDRADWWGPIARRLQKAAQKARGARGEARPPNEGPGQGDAQEAAQEAS